MGYPDTDNISEGFSRRGQDIARTLCLFSQNLFKGKTMERCILVVDDDESILEFVSDALHDEGYKVRMARNGAVALEVLNELGGEVCLVLLDMKMPIMDGYAFLETYCTQVEEPAPIIAFSANAQLAGEAYCIRAFLKKPFDLMDLFTLIEQHIPPSASS